MTPEQEIRAIALRYAIEYTKSWKVAPSIRALEDVVQGFYVWISAGEGIELTDS